MRPPPRCTVRGAAASLLDQSALHGGFRCRRQTPAHAWSRTTTLHHSSARGRRRARTLNEATSASHRGPAASLLDQPALHGGFRCRRQPPARAWSRTTTLHHSSASGRRRAPSVEQPQACSVSRSFMTALCADMKSLQVLVVVAASTLHPSATGRERARTLNTAPPRTVEQPQACSISWRSMAASVAEGKHLHVPGHGQQLSTTRVPAAEDEHAP